MNFDYQIEGDQIFIVEVDGKQDKIKKRRKVFNEVENKLWWLLFDKINDRTGVC